jgi:uncharacterized protein affecting Mg2+/Co2+ transport
MDARIYRTVYRQLMRRAKQMTALHRPMWLQALPQPKDFTSFKLTDDMDNTSNLKLFPSSLDYVFQHYDMRQVDGDLFRKMVRYAYKHKQRKNISVDDCFEALRVINLQCKLAESTSFATTRDVRIITTTFYSPAESCESAHRFYYRIFIENLGADPVTLRSRHWRFTSDKNFSLEEHTNRLNENIFDYTDEDAAPNSSADGDSPPASRKRSGKKPQVRAWDFPDENVAVMEVPKWAPGVVGEMPKLPQGMAFQYLSSCILRYPTGYMEGAFLMINTAQNAAYEYEVGRCPMLPVEMPLEFPAVESS